MTWSSMEARLNELRISPDWGNLLERVRQMEDLSPRDALLLGLMLGRGDAYLHVKFGGSQAARLPLDARMRAQQVHDLVERLLLGAGAGAPPAARPQPSRQVPITLNSLIHVRLTERGHKFLRDEHATYWQAMKDQGHVAATYTPHEYVERSTDERGRSSFPLWEFAEKFAPLMSVGIDVAPYFADDIRLEIEVNSPASPQSAPKYRKKPVVVEARQFHGTSGGTDADLAAWAGAEYRDGGDGRPGVLLISTLEGVMEAHAGDYIICGVAGEFYPCRRDIFEATYERA